MRLPKSAHAAQHWRIDGYTADFELEDVWALPTPGGEDDFPDLVELIASFDPARDTPHLVRTLFTVRTKLGEILGWDGAGGGIGARVESLGERLPDDLSDTALDLQVEGAPFTPLYRTDNEFAAEVANRTVHGVIHLGWVPDGAAGYRGQMAILVKPNGRFGRSYLAAIKPFRHPDRVPAGDPRHRSGMV
ncbi:MAG: DUF2867 domain-containing protein [Actinomycetota bacterium]